MTEKPSGKFEQSVLHLGEIQVISAMDELFNHFDSNLPMWTGSGDRIAKVAFVFDEPFRAAPAIVAGVVGIDSDSGRNLRFGVTTENISATTFEVLFTTWSDTLIARASISWQAIGPKREKVPSRRPRSTNSG